MHSFDLQRFSDSDWRACVDNNNNNNSKSDNKRNTQYQIQTQQLPCTIEYILQN